MVDLRNCPLCGADARLTSMDGMVGNGHTLRFVACTNEACQASVWKHSDEEAIAAWNRRYPTAWCDCGDSHTNESVCANCFVAETAQPEGMVSVPRELIEEMAGDIEAEVTHRYVHNGEIHPAEQRKYDNDMEVVKRARQALERGEGK